jgi:hypothetical protein
MIARRSFLTGLITAPVIIRASSLMPVKIMRPTIIPVYDTIQRPLGPYLSIGIVQAVKRTENGLLATIMLHGRGAQSMMMRLQDPNCQIGEMISVNTEGNAVRTYTQAPGQSE